MQSLVVLLILCVASMVNGLNLTQQTLAAHGLTASTTYLNLTNLNIEFIDDGVFDTSSFPNLIHIDLAHNMLTTIGLDTFRHLTSIQQLDLSYNSIAHIDTQAFAGLNNLVELNLNHNSLAGGFDLALLSNINSIGTVDLSNNQIESLVPLPNATQLTVHTLSVDSNRISSLSASWFVNLLGLTSFSAKYNALQSIDSAIFAGMNLLNSVDLSWNNIETLASGLFDGLSTLAKLDLSHNRLAMNSGFTNAFSGVQLPLMTLLFLADNRFVTFNSTQLSSLNKVRVIDLANNKLASVDLSAFTSVMILDLHNNMLVDLPATTFASQTSLFQVNLAQNQLTSLNDKLFAGKSTLSNLDLAHNNLVHVNMSQFSTAYVFKSFNLSSNRLEQIAGGLALNVKQLNLANNLFSELNSLVPMTNVYIETLNMSGNMISQLAPNAFSIYSEQLLELDLSHNQINELEADSFANFAKLVRLNLSNNHLRSLGANVFRNLSTLNSLDLSMNNELAWPNLNDLNQDIECLNELIVNDQIQSKFSMERQGVCLKFTCKSTDSQMGMCDTDAEKENCVCLNGGFCSRLPFKSFETKCVCPKYFYGESCQKQTQTAIVTILDFFARLLF